MKFVAKSHIESSYYISIVISGQMLSRKCFGRFLSRISPWNCTDAFAYNWSRVTWELYGAQSFVIVSDLLFAHYKSSWLLRAYANACNPTVFGHGFWNSIFQSENWIGPCIPSTAPAISSRFVRVAISYAYTQIIKTNLARNWLYSGQRTYLVWCKLYILALLVQ